MAFEQKMFQITLSEHALWMPVYTQPRHEFRLHDYLKERGIPVYLPVVPDIKIHRVHKGASQYTYRKTVLRPMFQSYLFAQMTEEEKRSSWNSNSIIHIWPVSREEQSAFVSELRSIQLMEELAGNAELEFQSEIRENDRFMIDSPPYEGICGCLLEKRKRFLWAVKLEFLHMVVLAEIDPSQYKLHKLE